MMNFAYANFISTKLKATSTTTKIPIQSMSVKTGDRKNRRGWGWTGGSVVGTLCFHCKGQGLIPGWGNKILHVLQPVPTSAPTPQNKGRSKWVSGD